MSQRYNEHLNKQERYWDTCSYVDIERNKREHYQDRERFLNGNTGQYALQWNADRNYEIRKKFEDILWRTKRFILSKNMLYAEVAIVVISCLVNFKQVFQAIVGFNVAFIAILMLWYYCTSKCKVRGKIVNRNQAIEQYAHSRIRYR